MTRLPIMAAALVASSSVAAAQGLLLTVTLSEWKVRLSRDTVTAASVTFRVSNGGSMNHAFYVRGTGVEKGIRDLAKGESGSLTVTLKPGTYDLRAEVGENFATPTNTVRLVV